MHYMRMVRWTLLSSAISITALAQGSAAETSTTKTLTDPQIAAIVVAANQADIDTAKVAKSHSKKPDVVSFADTMIRDHTSSNTQAKDLAKRLNVTPEENTTSKSLARGAKQTIATLKRLKGPAFDRDYVNHEVTYHEQVLATINNELIPNAKNPELKALLEKTAPVIQAHLDHAKTLQGQLSSGIGGSGQ